MSTPAIDAAAVTPEARRSAPKPDNFTQLLCAWSGPVATVLALLGMVILSGFIPATNPAASGREIADFYLNNLYGIRFGQVIAMIAFTLLVPFGIAVAMQTRRIEENPVLTYVQIASVAISSLEGIMSNCMWLTASFRPDDIDPNITRALHDLGWISFLVDVPIFSVWVGVIGIAILRDRHVTPLFPRWIGFFNLWCAIFFLPALLIPFFKSGPFAYNGLLALYLPFGAFFTWIVVMTPAVLKAIGTQRNP